MRIDFWLAIAIIAIGWYFTATFGAQLRQYQLAEDLGQKDDVAFEFRRLGLYLILALTFSIGGIWWLHQL